MAVKKMQNLNFCPMIHAMNMIGNKWSPIIIYVIGERTVRFGQLAAMIDNISRKVLAEQLKSLEKEGIIRRESFAEVPPRVEYSLTKQGVKLIPILNQICYWGSEMQEKEKLLKAPSIKAFS